MTDDLAIATPDDDAITTPDDDGGAASALLPVPRDAAASLSPPHPAPPPEEPDAAVLVAAVERLEQVLEHETRALSSLSVAELKEIARRKSLCLLELTRAARGFGADGAQGALRPRLERLRASIARNQAALEIHLEAVRDIAGTIAAGLEARESDGTYTASQGLSTGRGGA